MSLTGFGGVAAQARYHLVTRRRWLTDREFADAFGLSQVLPGANIANLSVIVGDRYGGVVGIVVCLASLCIPALIVAIVLMLGAIQLTKAFPRFTAVEGGITASVAGMIIANGVRVAAVIWQRSRRIALGISFLTTAAIIAFGVPIPAAIVAMLGLSILLERSRRT